MKIGLLECDHVAERFRRVAGDYHAMFGALFRQHAPGLTLEPFDVCDEQFPALDDCDGFITTGSRFSVYDDVDWIYRLKGFVRQARDTGKPFVGVCFGHQMLAEALGGKVEKAADGWGVGVHAVEVVQEEAWMRPAQPACRLQYMHRDQVVRLPENAVLLGQSAHCPAAMLRVGKTMLGIQAHPEFSADYVEALLLDRVARIGEGRVREAQAGLRQATDENTVAKWIAEFLKSAAKV
jgi:GMP synthase-like glutamine amidotransferase